MPITRRKLLGLLSGSTFFLSISPGATLAAPAELPAGSTPLDFPQGVASGDPQPDAIMLWTRAVPRTSSATAANLLVQLSRDADFSTLLLQTQLSTDANSDYTVRSYIDGLAPDTQYYYRFLGAPAGDEQSVSRIGRTRTAPKPGQAGKVNLAFASCQSYEQAFYGSWARMLEDDHAAKDEDRIHFVLHLGDFIYERCWKERPDGGPNSRTVPPFPDGVDTDKNRYAVSLADYRHLYKTYLSDPHLQEARANWPFICTWDDHEFANDNYQSFVTYDGAGVLDAQRKTDANRAWFEFIPAVLDELQDQPAHGFQLQPPGEEEETRNRAAVDSLRIYRKLSWGKTLDIVLTDSRSYRSASCLPQGLAESLGMPMNSVELVAITDAGNTYANGQPPATLPFGDGTTDNPARDREPGSLLGAEQREWFLQTVKNSTAAWKIWGNALPLIPMRLDLSSLPMTGYADSIFSIDGWAGYPHELGLLMQAFASDKVTGVVSLSGDHHMHGAGTIQYSTTDTNARPVAVDFTVAGISSTPIFEDLLAVASNDHPDFAPLVYRQTEDGAEPVWNISMTAGVLAAFTYAQTGISVLTDWLGPNTANPGLRYVDTTVNGYGLATVEADKLTVQLVALQDCRQDFVKPPAIRHTAHFSLPRWAAGEVPDLQGPEFEGGAPFPFEPESV